MGIATEDLFAEVPSVIRRALSKAGWSENRSVPTDEWAEELTAQGFPPHVQALRVLAVAGGLTVSPVKRNGLAATVVFDPVAAAEELESPLEAVRFEELYGQRFCPIAVWGQADVVLLGEHGRVVAIGADELLDLGEGVAHALGSMLSGDPPAVPIERWRPVWADALIEARLFGPQANLLLVTEGAKAGRRVVVATSWEQVARAIDELDTLVGLYRPADGSALFVEQGGASIVSPDGVVHPAGEPRTAARAFINPL